MSAVIKVVKHKCTLLNKTISCKYDCRNCFLSDTSGGYPDCPHVEFDGYEFIEV